MIMTILRIASSALAVVCAAMWVAVISCKRSIRYASYAVITWSANILVFYAVVASGQLTALSDGLHWSQLLNAWSSTIRIHGLLLLIAGAYLMLRSEET